LSSNKPSRFSRDFKLEVLRRMEAGENVSVLARELGVSRKSIYQWRNRYRLGGSNALRGRGRMTKAGRVALEETILTAEKRAKAARQASMEELARAQRRIAALERKIGQQQVVFFSASLAASQGTASAERRAWRDGVYEVIQTMTASRSQGELGIERLC
jgi:transposase-like protein